MTDTTARRMTVNEIALMRAIVEWRRATGVTFYKASRLLGGFALWADRARGGREVAVDFYRGDSSPYAEMTAGKRGELGGLEVDDDYTVSQAVDVLVSLGYLPARFSSAYRAGWNAAGRVLDTPNSEIADVEYALHPVRR